MQSGKPVGVFRTHADAPRVLIANSNIVPHWATLDYFNELDRKGLMMYGQMTAGSWIYIGSQGIVQGTYETFVEVGRQHYGGDLSGRWILTAGLGGMGGAQPLAATMAGASMLAIECQPSRIEMRLRTGYVDMQAKDLDEALDHPRSRRQGEESRLGRAYLAMQRKFIPELVRRGVQARCGHRPDLGARSDQWLSARRLDALPNGRSGASAIRKRSNSAAKQSMAVHVRAMLDFQRQGIPTLDYGNNIRQRALEMGVKDAFDFPGLRARLHPSAVLPRHRSVPLGRALGRSRGHLQDRRQGEGADAARQASASLARHGEAAHHFQGLPARICWVGLGDRHRIGLAFNEMVASG